MTRVSLASFFFLSIEARVCLCHFLAELLPSFFLFFFLFFLFSSDERIYCCARREKEREVEFRGRACLSFSFCCAGGSRNNEARCMRNCSRRERRYARARAVLFNALCRGVCSPWGNLFFREFAGCLGEFSFFQPFAVPHL